MNENCFINYDFISSYKNVYCACDKSAWIKKNQSWITKKFSAQVMCLFRKEFFLSNSLKFLYKHWTLAKRNKLFYSLY